MLKEYFLENEYLQVKVLNLGGILKSIKFKDKKENFKELILGYKNNDDYLSDKYFLGAFIGRIAGRISNSKFTLNSKEHLLNANENKNFLHGGKNGIHKQYFELRELKKDCIKFFVKIEEKNDGIPGDTDLIIEIKLVKNSIQFYYSCFSSEDTIVNFTNHNYWNLNENKTDTILNHTLNAENTKVTMLDENFIPNNKFEIFSSTDTIKNIIEKNDFFKNGIDHFFETKSKKMSLSNSDLKIYFETSEPGFVVYSGNFLNNLNLGDEIINKFGGVCLEDQNFQDSINNKFSNWILKKNEIYTKSTIWKFENI